MAAEVGWLLKTVLGAAGWMHGARLSARRETVAQPGWVCASDWGSTARMMRAASLTLTLTLTQTLALALALALARARTLALTLTPIRLW